MRFFRKLRNAIGKQGSQPNHTRQRATSSRLRPLRCEPLEDRRMLSITLFVDGDAAPGGNGLSWATAVNDLQLALNRAYSSNNYDTDTTNDIEAIWIAEGTYYPSYERYQGDERSATFKLAKNLAIYGGFAGTETALSQRDISTHTTILSGDIGVPGDTSDNAYSVVYNSNQNASIDGLFITNGHANGSGFDRSSGGGVYNTGNLYVTNSVITKNSASHGGGCCNYGIHSTMTITNSTISDNLADSGGGICSSGFDNSIAFLSVINSIITGNAASGSGGGIYSTDDNHSSNANSLTITNSTIINNSAINSGGVYHSGSEYSQVKLNNTIVAKNSASADKLDINIPRSTLVGSCNLIGNGEGQNLINGVNGNRVGTVSLPIDPMLSDWSQFDNGQWGYYLLPASPAINAGNNTLAVDETGQYLEEDIYGNPRVANGIVDIGAIEGASSAISAESQTYVVTSLEEKIASDGVLTFIEAFEAANSNRNVGDAPAGSFSGCDIIQFDSSLFADETEQTILLHDGQLIIHGDLSIEGAGESLFTINAASKERAFFIQSNASVTLSGMTITGGAADSHGGGIWNGGDLTLTACTVSNNSTQSTGGGIFSTGILNINNSIISNNLANGGGSYDYIGGGGIYNLGNMTITNSTVSDNKARRNGGGIFNGGELVVLSSTISDNSASNGGGFYNGYYSIFGVCTSKLTITNSTISGNTASNGAGIYNGNYNSLAILEITNSTIVRNSTSGDGGGIYCYSYHLNLNNTIIAENYAYDSGPDLYCTAQSLSGAHNLIGDGTDQVAFVNGVNGNQVGNSSATIAPLLSDWSQFNNGQWGYYLLPGSPAIDAGDNSLAIDATGQPLTKDLYGNARISGNAVDIGSLEGAVLGNAAQTYVVTSLEETIVEDGILTFIEAFEAANNNRTVGDALAGSFYEQDTIQFAEDLFTGGTSRSILIDNGELVIFGDLSIQGPYIQEHGSELLIFDGAGQNRLFEIRPEISVNLNNITITNGAIDGGGGGILNNGTLKVINCVIAKNLANVGGGIYSGNGSVEIVNSLLTDNSASGSGGGIYNYKGLVTVTDSIISGNTASNNGGGIGNIVGTTIITSSTISNNSASDGGGIYNYSSVYKKQAILEIANSIVSRNSASNDGGGIRTKAFSSSTRLTIVSSTISENSAGNSAGGIYHDKFTKTTLDNTIVAANAASTKGPDIYFTNYEYYDTLSGSHNLIGNNADNPFRNGVDGNLVGTNEVPIDPRLGEWLQFNNGRWGYALSPGSPAIDAGDNALAVDFNEETLLYDIAENDRIQNGIVDIGAYETYGITIEAGGPYTLDEGSSVLLDASDSTNELYGFVSYEWDFDGDGEYDDALGETVNFTPNQSGSFIVSVKVTDSNGIWGTDDAEITVNNINPTANAGGPYSGVEGETILLNASGSADSGNDIASYLWDFDNDGQYDDADGIVVDFSFVSSGSYTVGLKVTDDDGAASTDSVIITVNNIEPVANAGGPYVGGEGTSVILDASGSSDPGNDIVLYEWDFDNDGQYDDATGVTVDFSSTEDGSYTVGLRVTDDDGASSVDSVTVTVNNVAPTADAGGPYVVDENKEITLDASGSTDPGDDIVSYEWDLDGDGQYDDATGVAVDFSRAASGNYTVRLKVTDDDGGVGIDSVTVTVNDVIPTADTGGPYTMDEGDTVTLDASGSTDPGYAIVSYEWDLDNDGQYDDASGATTSFNQIISGSHTVRVKVTAADGDWDVAATTVTVNPIIPEALFDANPVVGTSDITFSVTYSDNVAIFTATIGYGDIRLTGPNGYDRYATLLGVDDSTDGSPRIATYRTASPDSQWTKHDNGTYQVMLNADQVSDTAGNFVASGWLGNIVVNISNLPPVADAGGPYAANEDESVTLDASGSDDIDGTVVSYAWDFDGDGEYDDATGMIVNFTPTASGNFTVGLQVTDDEGVADTDNVVVTINNIAPTADAGGSYGTREGLPVTLDASGSTDPGNDIVSYAWDFDGDGEYDDAFGVTVDFSPTHSGDQTVSVKVTDDDGDFDTADAQIAVRNIKPTANAGGPYTCTEGDALTLDASASADPGNDIVSYEWDFNSDAVYDDAEGAVVQFPTSTAGTFVAAVKVTDDDGATSTALALVTIQEKPVQDWGTVRLNLRDLADTKDIDWLDEWSGCWIEVWATGTVSNAIDSFDVELAFEADCFTPELAMVQPGEKVNSETLNVILNESTGNLQITGTTLTDNAGQGSEALLAKLAFKPTPGESVLPRDTDGKYLEPVADAGFQLVQAALTAPNSSTISTATIAPQDNTPLWPVMYDLNGDSTIDLLDVAQMLAVFQWKADENAPPMAWASDFDHSGTVDLLDVAEMLARFQYRKSNGNSVTYPAAFPFDTTESSTAASVGKTTVPRQKSLPSCRFIPPTPGINEVVLAKSTWNKFDVTAIAKDLIPVFDKEIHSRKRRFV